MTRLLVSPNRDAGFVLAVGDDHLFPGLRGVDERQAEGAFVGHPDPQGGQRRGGGQLVEAGEEARVSSGRAGRRRRARSAVSRTCSATAVISGAAEAYGSSRPSRYTVPRRRISSARSVAGRPGPGTQRVRMSGWKNSAMACCTVVTVLPTVSGEPCSAPASSPSQNRAACGCCCRISAGLFGGDRVGDPLQDVVEGAAGERGGVEERLAAPWRSRRRRSGPRSLAGRR